MLLIAYSTSKHACVSMSMYMSVSMYMSFSARGGVYDIRKHHVDAQSLVFFQVLHLDVKAAYPMQ